MKNRFSRASRCGIAAARMYSSRKFSICIHVVFVFITVLSTPVIGFCADANSESRSLSLNDWFLSFIRYGNYCGPSWTGGHLVNSKPLLQCSIYDLPPIDERDKACQIHDYRFAINEMTANTPETNINRLNADLELLNNSYKSQSTGIWNSVFKWGLETYFLGQVASVRQKSETTVSGSTISSIYSDFKTPGKSDLPASKTTNVSGNNPTVSSREPIYFESVPPGYFKAAPGAFNP